MKRSYLILLLSALVPLLMPVMAVNVLMLPRQDVEEPGVPAGTPGVPGQGSPNAPGEGIPDVPGGETPPGTPSDETPGAPGTPNEEGTLPVPGATGVPTPTTPAGLPGSSTSPAISTKRSLSATRTQASETPSETCRGRGRCNGAAMHTAPIFKAMLVGPLVAGAILF